MKNRIMSGFMMGFALLALSACGSGNANWYDYGNGRINLDHVSHIKPLISAYMTFSSDDIGDLNQFYQEKMNFENVEKYKSFMNWDILKSMSFYKVKIKTLIMFDDFELTVSESETYLKHPSYMVTEMSIARLRNDIPDINEVVFTALNKLNGQTFKTEEDFLDAIAKTNLLNMESSWVRENLSCYALTEKECRFEQLVKNEKENLFDKVSVTKLRDDISNAYKEYKDLPL